MTSDDLRSRIQTSMVGDIGRRIDDVSGMEDTKALLMESVIVPLKTGTLTKPLCLLLCGAPGTGKSYLVRSLAKDISPSPLYAFYCMDIVQARHYADAEILRLEIFREAAAQKLGALVLLDEMETVCAPHCDLDGLIQQLSALPPHVVVICVSLRPWTIPPEVLPVFDQIIYAPLPDRETRVHQIRTSLGYKLVLNEEEAGMLADISEGFTKADISQFLHDAEYKPIKEFMKAQHFIEIDGKMRPCNAGTDGCVKMSAVDLLSTHKEEEIYTRPMSLSDVQECLSKARPSVTEEDIGLFKDFLRDHADR